ncbi:MAG: hypothetical protein M3403_01220 [Gemmatimonadota bacterium]|nr:hypothetical protein [Gemmatimonadota bacterium]
MLGFTRDSGPLTPLARRSPAAFAAVGFLLGLLVAWAMLAFDTRPAPTGWLRVAVMFAMGLSTAFTGWWVAQRVRRKSKLGG